MSGEELCLVFLAIVTLVSAVVAPPVACLGLLLLVLMVRA